MHYKIIQAIDLAMRKTEEYLMLREDPLLRTFLTELQRYKNLINDHWPLTSDEKISVNIGRVAVREFDEEYPDYVTLLSQIGAALREEIEL